MIKILIVDDSTTQSKLLQALLDPEPDMQVIGVAHNGKEAVEMVAELKPDIITMDLEMPVMDGHTATRLIMSQHPTPIVVISAKLNDSSADMTYLALEAGAVSVIAKPTGINTKEFQKSHSQIVNLIRAMSEIKVIKRRFKTDAPIPTKSILAASSPKIGNYEIVAIGTSIGGPQVLKRIFSQLPSDFPVPVVVVQHMANGFIPGFTKWLNNNTSLVVKEAEHNEVLKNGVVYFAPDEVHLTVARVRNALVSQLVSGKPVSGFCPSITVLLQSVAKTSADKAVGILLTGMGSDGSQGLLELRQANGHTIIQDEKSCVVFGMAGVALTLGGVDVIVQSDQIAEYLIKITHKKK